jgi:hypothetical protein
MKRLAIAVLILLLTAGVSFATTAQQVDFLLSGSLDGDGAVNTGGKVYTCDAGTVCGPSASNPKTTWTDANKVTASANPVILDAYGRASVFADGNYKFQIYDSSDVLIETIDNIFYDIGDATVQTQATLTPSSQTISTTVGTYYCNAQAGDVTTDFSGVSAVGNTGKRFTFKKTDSTTNTCTIDVLNAQTIDGATTAVLRNQYDDITIESDGTNWTEVRGMVWSRAATFHNTVTVYNAATFNAATTFQNTTSFFNSATFATGKLLTNTVDEETAAVGVTVDGVLHKDSEINIDVINEASAGTGVTVDGVLLKDGTIVASPTPAVWPSFKADRNGSAQANITGTDQIEFNNEVFDTNSNYNTTTFRFIPTSEGVYFLHTQVAISDVQAGDLVTLYIYKNGAAITRVENDYHAAPSFLVLSSTALVTANGTTDYFEVFVLDAGDDTSDLSGNVTLSYFEGSKIAEQ